MKPKQTNRPGSVSLTWVAMLAILLGALGIAFADTDFSGKYICPGTVGPTAHLTIKQDGDGNATGTLTTGGVNPDMEVKGSLVRRGEKSGKLLAGYISHNEMRILFTAEMKDGKLIFTYIPIDDNNQPIMEKAHPTTFSREAGGGDNGQDSASPNEQHHDAAPPAGKFTGTFKNDKMVFVGRADGNGYGGTIRFNGEEYKFTGNEQDGKLAGTFKTKDDYFDFTASLDGNHLKLTTGDTDYNLTRQGSANPLGGSGKTNPLSHSGSGGSSGGSGGSSGGSSSGSSHSNDKPAPVTIHDDPTAKWKSYKHPFGLTMKYPPDWTAKETELGLQLTPPNPGSNAQGPTEFYLASGSAAPGINNVNDERITQGLDQIIGKLIPFLQRTKEPQQIRAATAPGMLLEYTGTNPNGQETKAQVYTTLLKGMSISVLAIGLTDRIADREKSVRLMFGSLGEGAAQKDPNLVGSWRFWSYHGSADGKYGHEVNRRLVLQADGGAAWGDQSETSSSVEGKNQYGDTTFTGGNNGSSSGNGRGSWSAGNGKLFVVWEDGTTSEWSYQVSGQAGNRKLKLQGATQKQPDEWTEGG